LAAGYFAKRRLNSPNLTSYIQKILPVEPFQHISTSNQTVILCMEYHAPSHPPAMAMPRSTRQAINKSSKRQKMDMTTQP
jgi:hypothetical protein